MPVIIRRSEIISDRIADLTIKTINIGADQVTGAKIPDDAIGSEHIASRAVGSPQLGSAVIRRTMYGSPVDYTKAYFIQQSGSKKTAYAAAVEVSYPTAYGSPPVVALEPQDSGIDYFYKTRVGSLSFSFVGSPLDKYVRWNALGFR